MAIFFVSIALLSSGCAKKKVAVTPAVQPAPVVEPIDRGAGMGSDESLDSKPRADQYGAVLEGRTTGPMLPIYFEFDQYNVREDQRDRMRTNAEYLSGNTSVRIRIEGNCDERGTNEYNMALGERRAVSAKKYLVNMGVSADRLETISYGEEKPLNFGHDDLAWSQNRRADFVAIR
jgi:peptidoglycan-associated lipoprotein